MDYYNPAQNAANLPSPCKEAPTSESEIHTKLYCYGLLSLWLMLMFSALIYQIRAIIKIRNQFGLGFIGSILRVIRYPFAALFFRYFGEPGDSGYSTPAPGEVDPENQRNKY